MSLWQLCGTVSVANPKPSSRTDTNRSGAYAFVSPLKLNYVNAYLRSEFPYHSTHFLSRSSRRSSGLRHSAVRSPATAKMLYRNLGSSDLKVSDVCLGTMTWGSQNTPEEAEAQLDYAIKERDVNFVDTAELYPSPIDDVRPGATERIIGSYFEKNPGLREKVIIASKVCGYWPNSPVAAARKSDNPPPDGKFPAARLSRGDVIEACNASLRRLKTDYIDLYQTHWPDRYAPQLGARIYQPDKERPDNIPIRETLEGIKVLLDEGKIRAYGVSNESAYGVAEYVRAADDLGIPRPCSIQNQFCLLNREFEGALAETCAPSHYNLSLMPYSLLGGGALTGKYIGRQDDEGRISDPALKDCRLMRFAPFQERYITPAAVKATLEYESIAKEAGLSLTTLAQAFCKSRFYVGSSIIGGTSVKQIRENIDSVETVLSEDVLKKIDQIHFANKDICITS